MFGFVLIFAFIYGMLVATHLFGWILHLLCFINQECLPEESVFAFLFHSVRVFLLI